MKILGFSIYYDQDSGELDEVRAGKWFTAESALMRADILKDCMQYFVEQYNATIEEMEQWMSKTSR